MKEIRKAVMAFLLAVITVLFASCNFATREGAQNNVTEKDTVTDAQTKYTTDISIVCGKEIRFIGYSETQKWIEPLEKLLSNVLIPYGERGELMGYSPTLDENMPAVPQSHSCALFDVSEDGVPELLIQPYGGFGSSGVICFEVYDIYTGECMGAINCGNDYSWSVYYRSDTEELDTVGRYWLRGGWAWRTRYINKIEFDAQNAEYCEAAYLTSDHEISIETIEREDPYAGDEFIGDEIEESYPNTVYSVCDTEVCIDDYFYEYDRFIHNYTRIPETELIILGWGEVADGLDDEDHVGRAARMARALVSTGQRFVIYEY